jgi:23S rRNA (uridine2552-2'-O)-methyltransferase
LIEIIDKFNLHKNIFQSDVVVDLGCAPGGWTQVLEGYILDKQVRQKKTTKLIALDIIKTEYITNNICFIEGDFEDNAIKEKIILETGGLRIGLILSDIAPNNIGHQSADRLTVSRIIESIIVFSDAHLSRKGCLIFKSLKGADEDVILGLKQKFKTVERFKPESSRKESSEIFIICREKK